MRGALLILLLLLSACTTAWQRHSQRLHEAQAKPDLEVALHEQRWLVDHAFQEAPPPERGKTAETDRYLALADLTAQAGNVSQAIELLRVALQTDPTRHEAIWVQLVRLPLGEAARRQVEAEFRWNLLALLPNATVPDDGLLPCWSYRVRQIHVRRTEVRQGVEGGERRVIYDARSWVFNASAGAWLADGDWVTDIGTETEPVNGPSRPRYRAIVAADNGFFVEDPVPPCHRHRWTGPFDPERNRLFVAPHLPPDAAP